MVHARQFGLQHTRQHTVKHTDEHTDIDRYFDAEDRMWNRLWNILDNPGDDDWAYVYRVNRFEKAIKPYLAKYWLPGIDLIWELQSKLGGGPMSSGGNSGIVAVTAPDQFPKAIWDELVKQGRLRYVGNGLYELEPQ